MSYEYDELKEKDKYEDTKEYEFIFSVAWKRKIT